MREVVLAFEREDMRVGVLEDAYEGENEGDACVRVTLSCSFMRIAHD